jgi:hypothetical protein
MNADDQYTQILKEIYFKVLSLYSPEEIKFDTENSQFGGKEDKAISVTGLGGSQDCEMSRLLHFLESRLTYGGEVVSLTRRPPFTPQGDSWYSFLLETESLSGHSAVGRIRSNEKSNDLIGN